jgi:hypothetical protein
MRRTPPLLKLRALELLETKWSQAHLLQILQNHHRALLNLPQILLNRHRALLIIPQVLLNGHRALPQIPLNHPRAPPPVIPHHFLPAYPPVIPPLQALQAHQAKLLQLALKVPNDRI